MPSLKISSGPYGSHSARAPFDPRFEETSPISCLVTEGEKIGNIKDPEVRVEVAVTDLDHWVKKAAEQMETWNLSEELAKLVDVFLEDEDDEDER